MNSLIAYYTVVPTCVALLFAFVIRSPAGRSRPPWLATRAAACSEQHGKKSRRKQRTAWLVAAKRAI